MDKQQSTKYSSEKLNIYQATQTPLKIGMKPGATEG
jgi:hypothetical protein